MKYYYYIYKINFLKIDYALLLDENIFLYPSWNDGDSKDESKGESSFGNFFKFNLNSSSLLLIRNDKEVELEELKKKIQAIITLFSIIVSNQLSYQEEFFLILENEDIFIKKAIINKFQENIRNINPNMVFIDALYLQANFKQILEKISENRISDYLYDLISGILLSLKEESFSIKLSSAWNALEHLVTRYWKITDNSKLYTIKKTKFDALIEEVKTVTNTFLEDKVDEDDINIDKQDRVRWDYKQLVRGHLTNNINQFSPVKFKIKKMFENEKMIIDDKLVDKINEMRNWIYHWGYSLEEIEEKTNYNTKEILMRFTFSIYERILRFISIIDNHAKFFGDQILFHNFHNADEKIKSEVEKFTIVAQDKFNKKIIEKIDSIYSLIREIREKEINVKFNWNEKEVDLNLIINHDFTKVNLPKGFPEVYFNFLVQNERLPIDSEEKKYYIKYASLKHEINNLNIIFKVNCTSNTTGDIKKIILEEL